MSGDAARAQGLRGWWESLPSARFTTRPNYIWFVVGTVCIGAFMAALDASIVNVALPDLSGSFHSSASVVGWVLISYLLTLTTLLTLFGRLADIMGRRPLYTFGFLVFIVGSAACGAAPNLGLLITARVVQAAGAAMLQANSVAIITATVPANVRGRAIGFQGSAQAIGLSVGPAVGGALIGLFGWRAIFYVNVPVGIVGTLMAAMILPRDRMAKQKTSFDWGGALLFSPFLISLMMVLTDGSQWGWLSPRTLGLFFVSVLLFVAFYFREKAFRAPLVDLNLFKIGVFSLGNFTGLLSYMVMFGVLFLMPFFFEHVDGYHSAVVGLLLTAVPVGMTVVAPQAGGLADRYGGRLLTTVGMALSGLAALTLGLVLAKGTGLVVVVIALFVVGVGIGAFTPPNNSSVMGSLPPERLGVGGGILNMSRSLGMAMGTALTSTLMVIMLAAASGSGHHGASAWIASIRIPLFVVAGFGILAAVLSYLKPAKLGAKKVDVPMEL